MRSREIIRQLLDALSDAESFMVGFEDDEAQEDDIGLETVREAIKAGEAFLTETDNQIALIWSIEDVLTRRPDLTDDQCREVLGDVLDRHDATLGVTWDTLDYYAQEIAGDDPFEDDDEREAYAGYCAGQHESGKDILNVSSWRETNG